MVAQWAAHSWVDSGWRSVDAAVLRDRIRGCLLASACGDALGAPFEGAREVAHADYASLRSRLDELHYTDDTAMTVVLAEYLADRCERGLDLDEDGLLRAFAREWWREPARGYGAGPPQIFRAVMSELSGRRVAREMFDGEGSFGNGGAMRVAPVALIGHGLDDVLDWARRSARVTHTHPVAQDGAALQAAAVSLAVSSRPEQGLDPAAYVSALASCLGEPSMLRRFRRVPEVLGASPRQAARTLGNGIAAVDSVPAAVAAFLQAPDDPATAIEYAITMGGDTDTIAAMAGGIAGARAGARALPSRWTTHVEGAARVTAVADRLADLAASTAR